MLVSSRTRGTKIQAKSKDISLRRQAVGREETFRCAMKINCFAEQNVDTGEIRTHALKEQWISNPSP